MAKAKRTKPANVRGRRASGHSIHPALATRIRSFNKRIIRLDGNKYTCAVAEHPVVLGEYLSLTADWVKQPGEKFTLYYSGPPGATVSTSIARDANSGGHLHPNGPTGTIQPASQLLGPNYPQNQTAIATAPEACGSLTLHTHYSQGSPPDWYNNAIVRVPGLVAFSGSAHITLTGSTSQHPQNHYGLQSLNAKIIALADRFYTQFKKSIFVNDMSLIEGGLFDIKGNWSVPHKTHRDGRRVDINSTSMSAAEKTFFQNAALEVGFVHVILETNPEHWHLEI